MSYRGPLPPLIAAFLALAGSATAPKPFELRDSLEVGPAVRKLS